MQKGSISFLLILVIVSFLLIPLGFLIFTTTKKTHDTENSRVLSGSHTFRGVNVIVNSSSGTWDMYEYLCKDKTDCIEDLFSGDLSGSVSGGEAEDIELFVQFDSNWSDYEYLKVFVKPAWGSTSRGFFVSEKEDLPASSDEVIKYKGVEYTVVLIPISSITDGTSAVLRFSN